MTKADMVSKVIEAIGLKVRMIDGLSELEAKLKSASVGFDQADFRKHADEFVSKTMDMFVEEYSNSFSEAELVDIIAFCETPSGLKFVQEIFKIQRSLASKLFFGGGGQIQ
jgi:hypothetical protein